MDLAKLEDYLKKKGEANYRIKQITEAFYGGNFTSFEDISNLPKKLRMELNQEFDFMSLTEDELQSSNNSHKASLRLKDDLSIETVLMEYRQWNTVCVSTQVGCAMGCLFCATGKMGFKRNLTSEEIVDQIVYWRQKGYKTSRVVFMGMGEPFLNWDNVYKAIEIIHDQIGIGWRKMSISTVGIVEGIDKLTETGLEINLAISLHSTKQNVRQKIMPSATKYPLINIYNAVRNYVSNTRRQVFFEYALIDGINDSDVDATDLAQFIRSNRLYFLNIIKLNPIDDGQLRPSINNRVDKFLQILDQNQVKYSLRAGLGGSIKAACGQLIK